MLIRWITERLGTAAWSPDHDVPNTTIIDVRDLVDKHGNSPADLYAKIAAGTDALGQGRSVVVCCDYGISRSNAVAAGIIALHERIDLDAAVRRIIAATGETSIKLAMLSTVRRALER